MSKFNCHTEVEVPTIGVGKQSKKSKIFVSVIDAIRGCIQFRTDRYSNLTGLDGSPTFQPYNKPEDQMNCPEPLCVTSGTLQLSLTNGYGYEAEATYTSQDDARDYVQGVVSYYITINHHGAYEITTKLNPNGGSEIQRTTNLVYYAGDTFPKTVLIQHPVEDFNAVLQGGATGFQTKVHVKFELEDHTTPVQFGLSSISLVQDRRVFDNNDVVVLTCVDDLDIPMELELNDPTCLGQDPDVESFAPELSINAQLVSGNYLKLFGLLEQTDTTTAFEIKTDRVTPESVALNRHQATQLASTAVRLPNYHPEECGYLSAQAVSCDAMEGKLAYNTLERLTSNLAPEEFMVYQDPITQDWYMVFDSMYLGVEMIITYPVRKEATVYDIKDEYPEGRRIRIMLPISYKNGRQAYLLSENAFVTSFPFGWSSTENTVLSFTVRFMKHGTSFGKIVVLEP